MNLNDYLCFVYHIELRKTPYASLLFGHQSMLSVFKVIDENLIITIKGNKSTLIVLSCYREL